MKRKIFAIISVLVCLTMVVTLAACGKDKGGTTVTSAAPTYSGGGEVGAVQEVPKSEVVKEDDELAEYYVSGTVQTITGVSDKDITDYKANFTEANGWKNFTSLYAGASAAADYTAGVNVGIYYKGDSVVTLNDVTVASVRSLVIVSVTYKEGTIKGIIDGTIKLDDESGNQGGNQGGGSATWLTTAELSAMNISGLAAPTGLTIASKTVSNTPVSGMYDKEAIVTFTTGGASYLDAYAQVLFNAGFKKGFDGAVRATYNADDNYYINNSDTNYYEFTGYIIETNYKVCASWKYDTRTSKMVLEISWWDTTPKAPRTTWLTDAEKTTYHIVSDLSKPSIGTLTNVYSRMTYGYGQISFLFTNVTLEQALQYANTDIYTKLGANKDSLYYSSITSFPASGNYGNGGITGFEASYYADEAADKNYVAQVFHYSEAESYTKVGAVSANSVIITFTIEGY